MSFRVYGWRGSPSTARRGPISTISPSSITATRWLTRSTTANVVADEQEGETQLALEIEHQVDHLRLDRDVERRDRLVGHDQPRLERQRAGDAQALALAAGELVREAQAVLGLEAHLPEAGSRPARRPARRGARPCTTIGSRIEAPTVLRGLSEP